MKTIHNISKNIKLTLILSVLVMLWSSESNAKPLTKIKLDSLVQLEGKITFVSIGNENSIVNTRFKNQNIARLLEEKYRVDGIDVNNQFVGHGYYYESVNVNSKEYVLLLLDKLHLKGKVGILDNLVPIQWI